MLRNLCKTNFTWTGRRLEKLHKTAPKDFTINQTIQQQYKDMKKQDLKLSGNVRLSNALKNIKSKQIHFIKPDPKQMSKYLRQEYKHQIDHGIEDELHKLRTLEVEDKTLKWQENRIMAEEAAKFKKIVFQKNETLRLLKKEENRPQNYLPIEQLSNESEYANLNQQQQYYQSKLLQLQNQRITNLIENKPEDAYAYLVKSQLITQFPQAKELINQQLVRMNSSKNEIIRYDNEQIDELVSEIEKSIDSSQAIIDWNSVREFYKRLLENQNNTLQQFHDHQQSVNTIQQYSNYLFDKFYNNSLDHRVRGKLTFNELTEEECIRYIKYDINQPEITLRLIDSIDRNKLTPPIVSSIIQKLATYPFKNKLNYIGLISDNRFRIIIQQMAVMQFDDQNLSQSLYALGIINPSTISTIYPKLSFHLYDNLATQLLERTENLTNSQLAMAVRNLQMLPIYKNEELQKYLIEEIKKRDNLTLFEAESYMRFMGRNDDSYSIELLKRAFNTEQIELEIDDTTIMIIGQSLQKQLDKSEIKTILERNTHLMVQPISECQIQHLSPFTILLAQCGFNKQSELVAQCKKRLMHILAQRKDMQDEKDIANLIAGLIQIDSQNLYGINSIYEIILLQTIYHKLPFRAKSNFHIPYQKLLSIIQKSKESFQDKSLIIVLQSLIVIQQINSQIFKELIIHIQDVQYLFSAYLSLQISDQTFDQLVYRFESMDKSQITPYGAVSYLWSLFYLNKLQLKDLSVVSKFNLLESPLDNTSKSLLILILSQFKQLHSLIEQIEVKPQVIEQKYLLALASQSINKDSQNENFSRLLKEQRQLNDKRQKEYGIERYSPEDIRKQVCSALKKLKYKEIETNKADELIYWDIYIKDINQGFYFVSINDLIKKEDKYIRNGLQNLMQKLFKVKFIIYEEWVRHPDQEEYLKQFL